MFSLSRRRSTGAKAFGCGVDGVAVAGALRAALAQLIHNIGANERKRDAADDNAVRS
jgi:hypothetical protein